MENNIKIAVIGGTGKSGKYLVNQLIKQGFPIKVLVRNPIRFQIINPLVEVVTGDVSDYNIVQTLISDCQAVISTLGMGIPPDDPEIFCKATANIIHAMEAHKVMRYIVITGLNVDTAKDKKGFKTVAATEWMKTNYPVSTTNKQTEYTLLTESKVEWTMVRLPLIELTDTRNPIAISLEDCPGDKISATDLACFLIAQLKEKEFIRLAPFVANI